MELVRGKSLFKHVAIKEEGENNLLRLEWQQFP